MDNPNVAQQGTVTIPSGQQVIVPTANINCTARLTSISTSLSRGTSLGTNLPMIQIWRPLSRGSTIYYRITQVQKTFIASNHYFAKIPVLNSIELLPGDAVGYYQPFSPQRSIWSIQSNGYTSYSNNASKSDTTIDINQVDNVKTYRQPLIELIFGKDH